MSTTLTYSYRIRLNCRIPDKEYKYRDEFTQEKELSLSVTDMQNSFDIIGDINIKMNELKADMFKEAARLGGADYQFKEEKPKLPETPKIEEKKEDSSFSEKCVECGESVAPGSDKFVNRIPVLDDFETKMETGHPYPEGKFMCAECDSHLNKDVLH